MENFDIAGLQANEVAQNFIMALNGAFFTSRKVGVQTTPYDIEMGMRNIQTASYIFNNNLKDIINNYDSGSYTQATQDKLNSIAVQLIKKGNHAIRTGIGSPSAAILGNSAHGAMGLLVARSVQSLDLSVKDSAGRTWKDPVKLIQTIVRDHAYQFEVTRQYEALRASGEALFTTGDSGNTYPINSFQKVRNELFHPNSNRLPRAVNV